MKRMTTNETVGAIARSTTRAAETGLLALALVALPLACGGQPAAPAAPAEITVRTIRAESESVDRIRTYPGVTASVRPVAISARVAGFLDTQHVADGAQVKAGDLLYTIDERPFQASLAQAMAAQAQAEAQVPSAQAALDLAARDVERNRPLAASGAISKQTLDQLETKRAQADAQLAAANAAVDAARAQADAARLNLSYCRIEAPMDGLLGKSLAYEGQMVGPGYTVQLNQLVQLDPMYAEFSPSATEWPLISELLAKGPVRAKVVYGGVESISAEGALTFSSNTVNASTSTITLRASFPNPAGAFRPGTFATVAVDLGEIPGVVMVPTAALVARETDFFVWRVKSDGTAENVRVRLSVRQDDRVGVVEGIVAGDRIVVAGGQKLYEGAKVVEQGGAAAGAANGQPSK
jgi:multidrug efflux system membrane fusion protein